MGKGKKKSQNMKKEETTPSTSREDAVTASAPAPAPTPAPAPAPVPVPAEVAMDLDEEFDGLGLSQSKIKKRRLRKKQRPAATEATPAGSSSQEPYEQSLPFINPVVATAPSSSWGSAPAFRPAVDVQPIFPPLQSTQAPSMGMPFRQTRPPFQGASTVQKQENKQTEPVHIAIPSAPSKSITTTAAPPSRVHDTPLCRFKIPKKYPTTIAVPARAISVLTNYLPMKIKALKIYRYDITFKPERPKKMFAEAYKLSKNKHFKNYTIAFDQMKNGYALSELPNITKNERFVTNVELIDNNGKTMRFEVSYKFTGIVDLGTILEYMSSGETSLRPPTEAIQCVDVVLRQGTLESYIKAGRQFFQRPSRPIDLGDGLEMWTGLFQSGIFTTAPYVNIDVAHKGFPRQQSLIDALVKDFKFDPTRSIFDQRGPLDAFLQFLKGLKVVAKIGGDSSAAGQRREFICNDLKGPSTKEKFVLNCNGVERTVSVVDYFATEKRVRLKYPHLNCVWVGPRDKTIYYPMELLEVSYGQAINKQLNDNQLRTMVRTAATPPDERKRKIEEVIQNMNYSRNPTFREFGLDISTNFHEVKAKVLRPPRLEVGKGVVVEPRKGAWQADCIYRPEALQSWGVIGVDCHQSCDLRNVTDMMIRVGKQMGMKVSEPMVPQMNIRLTELQGILCKAYEKNVKMLFVVISSRGRDYYQKIKQMAERDVGVLTQCICEQTVRTRLNPQTTRNILLKVNSKLMGINQVLDIKIMPACLKDGGVMVVGADVTHPSPEQSNIPSIAAVTASMDPKCFLYNIELSIQTPKKEMIVQFEDMMVDHLRVYRTHQNALPKKIYVFRDGVSEGQFAQVLNSELQAVHNAYRTVAGPQAKPEVLFLLVQKRHHTRFFVPNSSNNVEPGTVVDVDIVHASELDFYLVSHQAIKGTARPTRYHAVCNDGQIPHDQVEQLTYYLCHLYSRCMRSVSYPTPTYYAHLACLRARTLTHGEKFDNKELERKPKRLRVMDRILQYSRMFFV